MSDLIIQDQRTWEWYVASAGQTVFQLPFQFFEDADVEVYYDPLGQPPDPVSGKLAANQYVVTGAGVNFDQPRYITLVSPAASGAAVVVNRNVLEDQLVDFTVGGTITPQNLDFVNNKLTVLIQQVSTQLEKRGLLYPVTSLVGPGQTTLPVLDPGKFWQANALGNIQAALLDENDDWSTLRSQLVSYLQEAPGSDLIGYYDTVLHTGISLTLFLNTLNEEYTALKDGIPSTGFATLFIGALSYVPAGWIMMNDGTIGNAASGATTRANADTQALYEMLWNSVIDTRAPVSGGRGATSLIDFNNNKTITLTRQLGRALCVSGAGAGLTNRVNGSYLGEEMNQLTEDQLASHHHPSSATYQESHRPVGAAVSEGATSGTMTGEAGGNQPHNNMQPSAFWNVIIKL